MRRPFLIAAPVAALVLVLTGCGSSGDSGGAAKSPSAAAAKEAPLSAAEAHEIAVAAQLQAADLPGFTEDKSGAGDSKPEDSDKELQACVTGAEDPTYLADVSSSDFTKGTVPSQLQVSSQTQVVPTREQGKRELEKLKQADTLTCLNAALKKLFSAQAQGGTFEGELKRDPSTEDFGSDGAARFVLEGAFKVQGITVKMHVDLDQLLVDRAELTVSSFAIGEAPLPDADRDRIVRAVVDRARTAQKS